MASKIIERMQDNAEKLYQIRKSIAQLEDDSKKTLDVLKTERDIIQADLLQDMNKNGLASMKVKSGETFARQTRKSIEIVSETGALKWALDNKCYSLNRIVANQILKDAKEIPPCFDMKESEFISVRKAKKQDE